MIVHLLAICVVITVHSFNCIHARYYDIIKLERPATECVFICRIWLWSRLSV